MESVAHLEENPGNYLWNNFSSLVFVYIRKGVEHIEENWPPNLNRLVPASIEIAIAFWRKMVWDSNVDFWQTICLFLGETCCTAILNIGHWWPIWSNRFRNFDDVERENVIRLEFYNWRMCWKVFGKIDAKNTVDPERTAQGTCFKYLLSVWKFVSHLDFASAMPFIRRKNLFGRNYRFKFYHRLTFSHRRYTPFEAKQAGRQIRKFFR